MWYKIEDIESKYNISKFSIYALITQEPELRQYIKALEGVLQINDKGIEMLLKHVKSEEKKEASAPKVAVKEEAFAPMSRPEGSLVDTQPAPVKTEAPKEEEKKPEPKKEAPKKEEPALTLEEEFFTHTSLDREEDFFADEISHEETTPIEAIVQEGIEDAPIIQESVDVQVSDSIDMQSYIKALKEKMIIQNEQIRAINNFLEVSKKLLLQDEKIIHILEKTDLK